MISSLLTNATLTNAMIELNWDQWIEPFTQRWWQETTCCVLVGIACGVLGVFVVLRRMAMIGDALSHSVLPGVVIALMITGKTNVSSLLLGALIAGVVTAVLISMVSRFSRTKEDSAVGIVFTALFSLGIILISALPHGVHFDLKCFLFGDPLAVGPDDLKMMAVIAPLVVLIVVLLYHPLKIASFDPVMAMAMGVPVVALHYLLMGMLSATVVAGLKTTGVVLVVAMVITPASAAYQLSNRLSTMLVLSAFFGAISAAIGMSVAFVTNSPTGPAMVIVATLLFALAMALSPSHGLLFEFLQRRQGRRHIQEEDILKAVYKLDTKEHTAQPQADTGATLANVSKETTLSPGRILRLIELPSLRSLVTGNGNRLFLTESGKKRAEELVRAHRLWETYLSREVRASDSDVHTEADRLEHAHELADEVDAELGHPQRDPHGVAIPRPAHAAAPQQQQSEPPHRTK